MVIVVAPGDLGKPRPAIVVQADLTAQDSTTIIVCPLSSEVVETPMMRPVVDPTDGNGLRLRSQVMVDKIAALRRPRIRARIGSLEPDSMRLLDDALLTVLGLSS
ncbi:MAG TPA: type II toxin-antitoxin system PemK/MazF family toxin [Hyphomicrobiales bacterium]|nr:type II toxin-antitoxin system PemK/MazF family toxin [Hyphomicrobiales bacterium]